MVKKVTIKDISPAMSMFGWDLLTYIKGRKKMAITAIGMLLAYIISNNEIIAILAGGLFEMLIALGEYYFKPVNQE